jgi:hypothetical protein
MYSQGCRNSALVIPASTDHISAYSWVSMVMGSRRRTYWVGAGKENSAMASAGIAVISMVCRIQGESRVGYAVQESAFRDSDLAILLVAVF